MSDDVECDYCGRTELAYELRSDRGPVTRCIPCLAVERGQAQFTRPVEEFVNNQKHEETPVFDAKEDWDEHRRLIYESARDWYSVLGRIINDDPLVKRDPEAIGTLSDHTRTFLTNIMGSDAHYPPSEVAGGEVDVAQSTLGEAEAQER